MRNVIKTALRFSEFMKQKYSVIVIGIIMLFPCTFSQDDDTPELGRSFKNRALAAMKHSDPKKRKSAYRTFQHLGKGVVKDYAALLRESQRYHQASMRNTMRVRANPYIELGLVTDTLASERERVMVLIHTDWEKDPGKIRMLENEMKGLNRHHRKVIKLARANSDSIDAKMLSAMSALKEIQWELVSIERLEDHDNTTELPDQDEIGNLVADDIFEVEDWLTRVKLKKEVLDVAKRLDVANQHNANSKWANASQKSFSDHLNEQRAVIGLHPLLLEERLSAAAGDHSSDMKTLGFFAHTSPVNGKKSPADRARIAKFAGRWTGENIFMGSASPTAAYNAWFGSDGHRFVMFTRGGSNVVGVGVVGGHWTMMNGRM